MRFQNESAIFLLLLWENNRGKYGFFGLIVGFVTFQSALRLQGIQPVRKRARESRSATHEIFTSVETASTLLYAHGNKKGATLTTHGHGFRQPKCPNLQGQLV